MYRLYLVGGAAAVVTNGIVNSSNSIPFFYGAGKAGVMGGISGAISFEIGSASTYFGNAAFCGASKYARYLGRNNE